MNNLYTWLVSAIDQIVLKLAAVGAVIGLLVGMMRGIIEQKYGSLREWFGGLAAALLVGMMVHIGLNDADMSNNLKVVITISAAFVADDALRGLRALGAMLGTDPLGFFGRVISALRGGRDNGKQ